MLYPLSYRAKFGDYTIRGCCDAINEGGSVYHLVSFYDWCVQRSWNLIGLLDIDWMVCLRYVRYRWEIALRLWRHAMTLGGSAPSAPSVRDKWYLAWTAMCGIYAIAGRLHCAWGDMQ